MLVPISKTTRRQKPEGHNRHLDGRENLKPQSALFCFAGVFHQPSTAQPGVPEGATDAVAAHTVARGVGVRQAADPERASGLAPAQPLVSYTAAYSL